MKHNKSLLPGYIALFFTMMFVFCTYCKAQNATGIPRDSIRYQPDKILSPEVPNSMVRNIKKDSKGNILIASFKGVFRYNGKSFTNITSNINKPSFWDVLEDRKGNFWFATRDSGVYCYNGKSFRHFTTRDGLAGNNAFRIYEDKAGNIWIGTGAGASRYDGNTFTNITTKNGLPHNDVATIFEDSTGKLWFGTSGGACYYDGTSYTVLRNNDGKAFTNVRAIIEDKKGNIWFGATIIDDKKGDTVFVSLGLWRYDGKTFTKASPHGAYAIIQDREGNIWTTGELKANGVWVLSRFDHRSLYNKRPAVTEVMSLKGSGMLCGILEANDGSIWFGALGRQGNVYRYDGKTITNFKSKQQQ